MYGVTHKRESQVIDGTPEKRLFLSIISDYGLKTGICELIDNAIDFWVASGRKPNFKVSIVLDVDRQLISVTDNAGGVKESEIRLLVAPGASGNKLGQEAIGIFGVGGKRAGVALGERVEIRTRFKRERSIQIDLTSEWLASDSWHLAAYEIPEIEPGSTTVDISKLRQNFSELDVDEMFSHLGETYSFFISAGCEIVLNSEPVKPVFFESWAYPPGFEPRIIDWDIDLESNRMLSARLEAGLILDRIPDAENYGVYIYCNDRLIVKELRVREVGYFVSSEAGVPHPDASLCRVVIHFKGAAELMPWNSSKSGINFLHPAFLGVRKNLISLVSYYSSLSRRLKGDWQNNVFSHSIGQMQVVTPEELSTKRKLILPQLPRVRAIPKADEFKQKNKKIIEQKPWVLGLVESLGLVDVVMRQHLETKNRAALILLDSNFEISLKEFIVSRTDLFRPDQYNDAKIAELFKARHKVINEVRQHVPIPQPTLDKLNYYYGLRNKLIHERATVGITDSQISDCQKTIEKVLKLLFGLKF